MQKNLLQKNLFILSLLLLSLAACEGNSVKQSLGLKRNSPDEFMVISRQPLSLPPEFNLLPPGSATVVEAPPISHEAKKLVFDGKTSPSATQNSKGQNSKGVQSLLDKTGAVNADPNIRSVLDAESNVALPEVEEEEKGFFTKVKDSLTPDKKDPMVDIDKEEERIEKNIETGTPISEGEIPTKDSGKKGLLNEMLGL